MNNSVLNYHQFGPENGPPVIMLHGWGQSLQSLIPLGQLLSDQARVHLIDLPGFGGSSLVSEDWGTAEYADFIAAFMNERNIEKASILGHSFGGRVALQLAAKCPGRIDSLILISAAGLKPHRTYFQKIRYGWIRVLGSVSFLARPLIGGSMISWYRDRYGSSDYKNAGHMRGVFIKAVNEDLSGLAEKIGSRTLILWGEDDRTTPPDMAYRYNQLIRNSKLIMLSGYGHFPFTDMGAQLCAFHIRKFLKEN